jgi:hypothetical protein
MIQLEKSRLSQTHLVATPTSGRLPSGMEHFKTKSQHRLACTYQTRQCSILIFDGWFALPCLPTRGDISNFGLHKSLFLPLDPSFDVKPFTPAFWPKWGLPLDMQIPRHKALGGDQYSRAMSLQRHLVDLVVPGGWLRVADGLGTGFVDFNLLLKSKVAEYNWGLQWFICVYH